MKPADGCAPADRARWRAAFEGFCRKLQFRAGPGRRLLLKSPVHTARLALLREVFPRAQFVHVHRDPFEVFASSLNMAQRYYGYAALGRPSSPDVLQYVLEQYELMRAAFARDAPALRRSGDLVDIRFSDLDRDPAGEVRRIYAQLGVDGGRGLARVEAGVRAYLQELAGFKRNAFAPLSPAARALVRRRWRPMPSGEPVGHPAADDPRPSRSPAAAAK